MIRFPYRPDSTEHLAKPGEFLLIAPADRMFAENLGTGLTALGLKITLDNWSSVERRSGAEADGTTRQGILGRVKEFLRLRRPWVFYFLRRSLALFQFHRRGPSLRGWRKLLLVISFCMKQRILKNDQAAIFFHGPTTRLTDRGVFYFGRMLQVPIIAIFSGQEFPNIMSGTATDLCGQHPTNRLSGHYKKGTRQLAKLASRYSSRVVCPTNLSQEFDVQVTPHSDLGFPLLISPVPRMHITPNPTPLRPIPFTVLFVMAHELDTRVLHLLDVLRNASNEKVRFTLETLVEDGAETNGELISESSLVLFSDDGEVWTSALLRAVVLEKPVARLLDNDGTPFENPVWANPFGKSLSARDLSRLLSQLSEDPGNLDKTLGRFVNRDSRPWVPEVVAQRYLSLIPRQ